MVTKRYGNEVRIAEPLCNCQIVISSSGTIAAGTETIILDKKDPTIIDELNWSTDSGNLVQIRMQPYVSSTATPIAEIKYDGSGTIGIFPENLKTHGSSLFNFLEYDSTNSRYKLGLKKTMNFPEGIKISIRNIAGSSTFDYAIMIIGRYYG